MYILIYGNVEYRWLVGKINFIIVLINNYYSYEFLCYFRYVKKLYSLMDFCIVE